MLLLLSSLYSFSLVLFPVTFVLDVSAFFFAALFIVIFTLNVSTFLFRFLGSFFSSSLILLLLFL